MLSKEVVVKNMEGLHARPATLFIQKANTFKSSVWIENGDRRANGKKPFGCAVSRHIHGYEDHYHR